MVRWLRAPAILAQNQFQFSACTFDSLGPPVTPAQEEIMCSWPLWKLDAHGAHTYTKAHIYPHIR